MHDVRLLYRFIRFFLMVQFRTYEFISRSEIPKKKMHTCKLPTALSNLRYFSCVSSLISSSPSMRAACVEWTTCCRIKCVVVSQSGDFQPVHNNCVCVRACVRVCVRQTERELMRQAEVDFWALRADASSTHTSCITVWPLSFAIPVKGEPACCWYWQFA